MRISIIKQKFLLVILILTLCLNSSGQQMFEPNNKNSNPDYSRKFIELGIGAALSTSLTFSGSLNIIDKSKWGGNIRYLMVQYYGNNYPSDFNGGLFDGIHFIDPTNDVLNILSLNLIKEIPNKNNSALCGIEIGPSLIIHEQKLFTKLQYVPMFSRNYDISSISNNSAGIAIRVKGEVKLSKHFASGISCFTNINNIKSIIGFEFNIAFKVN